MRAEQFHSFMRGQIHIRVERYFKTRNPKVLLGPLNAGLPLLHCRGTVGIAHEVQAHEPSGYASHLSEEVEVSKAIGELIQVPRP